MTLVFKTPQSPEDNAKLRAEFTETLAKKIREIRKEKGMTQQDVSERAGLHLTYLGHIEAGKYRPSVYVLWKIANAIGTTLDTFI